MWLKKDHFEANQLKGIIILCNCCDKTFRFKNALGQQWSVSTLLVLFASYSSIYLGQFGASFLDLCNFSHFSVSIAQCNAHTPTPYFTTMYSKLWPDLTYLSSLLWILGSVRCCGLPCTWDFLFHPGFDHCQRTNSHNPHNHQSKYHKILSTLSAAPCNLSASSGHW